MAFFQLEQLKLAGGRAPEAHGREADEGCRPNVHSPVVPLPKGGLLWQAAGAERSNAGSSSARLEALPVGPAWGPRLHGGAPPLRPAGPHCDHGTTLAQPHLPGRQVRLVSLELLAFQVCTRGSGCQSGGEDKNTWYRAACAAGRSSRGHEPWGVHPVFRPAGQAAASWPAAAPHDAQGRRGQR